MTKPCELYKEPRKYKDFNQIKKYYKDLVLRPLLNTLAGHRDFEIDIEDNFMEEEVIVKRKSIELKPIDEEEAILQMELLGHNFFVYKDIDTDKICVLYKRKNGNYGIIETK